MNEIDTNVPQRIHDAGVELEPAPGVLDLFEAMEDFVTTGRRVPFTGTVVVNEVAVLELLDRMRAAMPAELVEAQQLLEERDQVLQSAHRDATELGARAREEAERQVREARAHAEALVAADAVSREAQSRAAATIADAEQRAAQTTGEADAYARQVMEQLAEQMERSLATVRRGIESLPAPAPQSRRRLRSSGE